MIVVSVGTYHKFNEFRILPDQSLHVLLGSGSRSDRGLHWQQEPSVRALSLLASNLGAAVRWFGEHFGLAPSMPANARARASELFGTAIELLRIDNVNVYIFERPPAGQPRPAWWPAEVRESFPPTEGTAIDHVAFSAERLKPVFARMQKVSVSTTTSFVSVGAAMC